MTNQENIIADIHDNNLNSNMSMQQKFEKERRKQLALLQQQKTAIQTRFSKAGMDHNNAENFAAVILKEEQRLLEAKKKQQV